MQLLPVPIVSYAFHALRAWRMGFRNCLRARPRSASPVALTSGELPGSGTETVENPSGLNKAPDSELLLSVLDVVMSAVSGCGQHVPRSEERVLQCVVADETVDAVGIQELPAGKELAVGFGQLGVIANGVPLAGNS